MVKNIDPTTNGSASGLYTNVNGTLFFHAHDGTHGKELWKSDGTDAGTILVKDITAGSADTDLDFFVNVNGILIFTVNDATNGTELWRSDGTDAGTYLLKDIYQGSNDGIGWSLRTDFVVFNGTMYFQAEDATNGNELWKTDGTTSGTILVKDIAPSNNGSDPEFFVVSNNTVYFCAQDINGKGIWKTDGTDAGTVSVSTLPSGMYIPSALVNVNGTMFFTVNDPFANGVELWKCDGTSAGTSIVKDINPGMPHSNPAELTNVNGTLYFTANDGANGIELWKSDGTDAGTVMVKNLDALYSDFTNANGTLYFVATVSGTGTELWRSDGTSAGTVIVADIVPGGGSSLPSSLTVVGSNLFFVDDDGTHGKELWSISGLPSAIEEEKPVLSFSIYPNPTNQNLAISTQQSELYVDTQIQIFDLTGKQIRSEKMSDKPINVSELANGFYVLSVNSKGKIQQQKFIVQH
ncbi:MAG: ELWxxDGT repeat protein [Chitinophagales bacterium]